MDLFLFYSHFLSFPHSSDSSHSFATCPLRSSSRNPASVPLLLPCAQCQSCLPSGMLPALCTPDWEEPQVKVGKARAPIMSSPLKKAIVMIIIIVYLVLNTYYVITRIILPSSNTSGQE